MEGGFGSGGNPQPGFGQPSGPGGGGGPGMPPGGFGPPGEPVGDPRAIEQLKIPAIILIVVASLHLAYWIINFVIYLAVDSAEMMAALSAEQREQLPPQVAEIMQGSSLCMQLGFVALGGLVLAGCIQMLRLRTYVLAMTAAIASVIPCLSPCCVVGIPFGIWALILLSKTEVKAAFES